MSTIQRPLHQYAVDPTAELETHSLQDSCQTKSEALMQANRADVVAVPNDRDHLAPFAPLALVDELAEQRAPDSVPSQSMIDIDRVLDGEPVGGASAIGRRVTVADDLPAEHSNKVGQATLQNVDAAAANLLDAGRLLLE